MTRDEAQAALAAAQRPSIPVRRRHLALYAVSETGVLAGIFIVLRLFPASWPPILVGVLAAGLVVGLNLLKNLVPVLPRVAKWISVAGSVLSLVVVFFVFDRAEISRVGQIGIALVPSVLAGVVLVLVGARRR